MGTIWNKHSEKVEITEQDAMIRFRLFSGRDNMLNDTNPDFDICFPKEVVGKQMSRFGKGGAVPFGVVLRNEENEGKDVSLILFCHKDIFFLRL